MVDEANIGFLKTKLASVTVPMATCKIFKLSRAF